MNTSEKEPCRIYMFICLLCMISPWIPVHAADKATAASAYTGPLFDAHLHYNEEAWDGTAGPTRLPMCWRA
jgi:hypothetical protein